ncbi:hypothetical protein CANARDRAFT_204459 [[Candida] arabinofermentans NRRL YB-2248]|uniref:DUF676 domain-containing protein n=1 Tax=[Candida] arabinofermentans NRRL YB-2248 TaxID=983967 RepID=A0A1E4STI7_9ASCO|nr:hypothetical protein CANARDRAFT_204459 [[Candida] arabinofermentans NRRL YB-2248]
MSDIHLVILCHGLWGVPDHFNYIQSQLSSLNVDKSTKLHIHKIQSIAKFKTYDGIDLCGARVYNEILQLTNDLNQQGDKVTKFSIVGYSLGGLICRYTVGLLYLNNYFSNIKPINFTTFCSPHVGCLTPGNSISVNLFNFIVPYLLGNSGFQLFLKDKISSSSKNNIPLLYLMSLPNSIFYKSLQNFSKLSLYSNIRSDIRTAWWCSGISLINPFEILDKNPNIKIDINGDINFENGSYFHLNFIKNYENVILDVNEPILLKGSLAYTNSSSSSTNVNNLISEDLPMDNSTTSSSSSSLSIKDKFINYIGRKFKWVTFIFKSTIYIPTYITYTIIHNSIQILQSSIRIFKEKLPIDLELYKLLDHEPQLNRLKQELLDQKDNVLESVFDAITSSKNNDESTSVFYKSEAAGTTNDKDTFITTLNKLCNLNNVDNHTQLHNFIIPLSNSQKEIISNLNQLPWLKFPVYITKTNATHAACIVRHDDLNTGVFDEGKVVVRHFVNEVFEV